MDNLPRNQTTPLWTRNRRTVLENNPLITERERWGGGRHTLEGEDEHVHNHTHREQNRRDLLESTGNSAHHPAIIYTEWEDEGEYIYAYVN